MERIPEPELMEDPAQAAAYAAADFSAPHQAVIDLFRARFPDHRPRRALDLGCGAADVTVRFARAYPEAVITGIDGAAAMLECGREAVRRAGLSTRITLTRQRLSASDLPTRAFDTVLSNSLLHHLHDPMVLWRAVQAAAAPGAAVMIVDLLRPASRDHATQLVAQYAAEEPEILRRDFFNSLLAAFRAEEVREQLARAGLGALVVEVVSDRHLVVHGKL